MRLYAEKQLEKHALCAEAHQAVYELHHLDYILSLMHTTAKAFGCNQTYITTEILSLVATS